MSVAEVTGPPSKEFSLGRFATDFPVHAGRASANMATPSSQVGSLQDDPGPLTRAGVFLLVERRRVRVEAVRLRIVPVVLALVGMIPPERELIVVR